MDGFVARVRSLWRGLRRRSALYEEMGEEFRFHIELRVEDLIRSGLSPAEAMRQARLEFGSVERYRAEGHEARGLRHLDELRGDLRYTVRTLRRSPGFTAAAVLTLALGIGVNAAVFGLVSASLLRPLPFPDADRLVVLNQSTDGAGDEPRVAPWSFPEFAAVRSSLATVSEVAAYYADDVNLAGTGNPPVRVSAEMVSASYFAVLGVRPALGRTFVPQEDSAPGAHPVAMLGHALWQREFGADPNVVGGHILLNGVALSVVGILPAGFQGLTGAGEVWIPHAMAPEVYFPAHLSTSEQFLSVVGRLRPDVSLAEARAEIASVAASAAAAAREGAGAGEVDGRWGATLLPLEEARRDPATVRAQLVLAGAAFLVLLIATVNLSGLLLARSVGRSRELAVRTALGAGRTRLLRQALVESGTIGVLGGVLGALIAALSIRLLAALAPAYLGGGGSRLMRLRLDSFATPEADWRMVAFAALLAVGAGLFAGLVAALRATRGELAGALRTGARGSSVALGTVRRPTLLSGIAVAQVACALVLLAGAGLLLKEFQRLRSLDPGLDAAGVVTFRLNPPESTYSGEDAGALLERVLERVEAVPGVASATVGRCLPGTGCSSTTLYLADRPLPEQPPVVRRHYVGPDHFRTLGIPLLRGRGIAPEDRSGRPRVAVINETAARRFWPGEDPLGKRVWFGSGGGFASPDSLTEIVGVVGDVRYGAPGEPVKPDFYTSYLQHVLPATMVMVRTVDQAPTLVPALRRAVAEVDPNLPIHGVRTVAEVGREALAEERFATTMLSAFAALGLLLASVGVYGVMAYSVAQRRREIGIRLALGAAPRQVLREVVGQGVTLAAIGAAIGLLLSLGLARLLSALIAGLGAVDPLVLAIVTLVLLLVASITCFLPARSAARVDPTTTLAAD